MDSKVQGIYVLGNDDIIDDALALMNSLRRHAPGYPVCLIPYDDNHHRLARILHDRYAVEPFEDARLFAELERHSQAIRGKPAPAYRKFACWFGPFDEFIYFDTDIVVFQDQKDVFELLDEYDIVYCGDGRLLGIEQVFTERVLERELFTSREIDDLFNTGFFASKSTAMPREQLACLLEEAVAVSDVFVPYLQEQPILNYVVLRAMPRRANLRLFKPAIPDDAWAGIPTLKTRDDRIYLANDMPVRNIHWAGFKDISRRPYLSLWLRYRYPGRVGSIQRQVVRLKWSVDRLLRRLLCIHVEGWHRPGFQISRAQRFVHSRVCKTTTS